MPPYRWLECRSSPRQTTNPDFLLPLHLVPFFAIVLFFVSSFLKSKNFEHDHVRWFSRRRQRSLLMNGTDPVLEWMGPNLGSDGVSSALPGNCGIKECTVQWQQHFANGRTNDTVYGFFWDWRWWTVQIRFRNDLDPLASWKGKQRKEQIRREELDHPLKMFSLLIIHLKNTVLKSKSQDVF